MHIVPLPHVALDLSRWGLPPARAPRMGDDDAKAVIEYAKTIPKLTLIPAPEPKESAMPEKPTTNPPWMTAGRPG